MHNVDSWSISWQKSCEVCESFKRSYCTHGRAINSLGYFPEKLSCDSCSVWLSTIKCNKRRKTLALYCNKTISLGLHKGTHINLSDLCFGWKFLKVNFPFPLMTLFQCFSPASLRACQGSFSRGVSLQGTLHFSKINGRYINGLISPTLNNSQLFLFSTYLVAV